VAADHELSQSDRRRSWKCRYLHLQVARRSQVLSGSGGTSADSKRKFASDCAASHAPSSAMTSAPRYFILRFHSNMTSYLVVSFASPQSGSWRPVQLVDHVQFLHELDGQIPAAT
jgi:hypothetical protein